MKAKKIYLIRHGETEFNRLGLVQGSGVDSNLNDKGRQQARAFYDHYRHLPFHKVYTSALRRTHQTVSHFVDEGIPHAALPDLNEMSWGHKEGRPLNASDNQQHYYMMQAWREGMLDVKVEGGESPLEVAERLQRAIEHILEQHHEEQVLVCIHGRAMRIFLSLITGEPMAKMDQFAHSNVSLYVLHYEHGQCSIELANDKQHLKVLEAVPAGH